MLNFKQAEKLQAVLRRQAHALLSPPELIINTKSDLT